MTNADSLTATSSNASTMSPNSSPVHVLNRMLFLIESRMSFFCSDDLATVFFSYSLVLSNLLFATTAALPSFFLAIVCLR